MEQDRVTKPERDAIAAYLDLLRAPKRKGRQRTLASAERELETVTQQLQLNAMSALEALKLTQRQMDLEREVEDRRARDNSQQLEADFIKFAAKYGEARGISYAAWRSVGVSAAVLRAAGIKTH